MSDTVQLETKIADLFTALETEVGFAATHLSRGATLSIMAEALFPAASTFKVPVLVEVFRQADAGRFKMTDRIALTDAQRSIGSGVLQRLDAGLAPTVRDLAVLMIIISDNTATQMLLDLVGADNVTATMRRHGLSNINVVMSLPQLFAHTFNLPLDPPLGYAATQDAVRGKTMDYGGLAFAPSPRNSTASAADMSALLAMIHAGKAGTPAACADMMAILRAQQLNERVPRYLPSGSVPHKTGTLGGVRNDVGLIVRGDDDVIAFALYTFDRTPLPAGNSRLLAERNVLVTGAMAEVGQILWDHFAV